MVNPVLTIRVFPILVVLVSVVAWFIPQPLIDLKPAIPWLLGVVMFGMGMTLTFEDFKNVLRHPAVIILGLGLQFLLMPFYAWGIGYLLGLDAMLLAGMVLVGASPGGTASNVICYLARGDVALSITLTLVSTLAAVFMTPLLTWAYVGQVVPVPVWSMLLSVLKIVLLPVLAGVLINRFFYSHLAKLQTLFPLISVLAIVVIIGIVVALNHNNIPKLGLAVSLAVVLHNLLGLISGYLAARWLVRDTRIARTLAIEVGMQNSGLAVALAVKYFSTAAALPGALFSVWHNLSGAVLASWWSSRRSLRSH